MKPTLFILIGCIAFACSPLSKTPKKNCLKLDALKLGTVTFEVNTDAKYTKYKRNYLVQIYADSARKKLVDNVLLSKQTDWTQTVNVKKEYCIVVFKDRTVTTYFQMEWTEMNPPGTAMIDREQKNYYASTKGGASFLFAPPISSKDGSAGDGVRAVVN